MMWLSSKAHKSFNVQSDIHSIGHILSSFSGSHYVNDAVGIWHIITSTTSTRFCQHIVGVPRWESYSIHVCPISLKARKLSVALFYCVYFVLYTVLPVGVAQLASLGSLATRKICFGGLIVGGLIVGRLPAALVVTKEYKSLPFCRSSFIQETAGLRENTNYLMARIALPSSISWTNRWVELEYDH